MSNRDNSGYQQRPNPAFNGPVVGNNGNNDQESPLPPIPAPRPSTNVQTTEEDSSNDPPPAYSEVDPAPHASPKLSPRPSPQAPAPTSYSRPSMATPQQWLNVSVPLVLQEPPKHPASNQGYNNKYGNQSYNNGYQQNNGNQSYNQPYYQGNNAPYQGQGYYQPQNNSTPQFQQQSYYNQQPYLSPTNSNAPPMPPRPGALSPRLPARPGSSQYPGASGTTYGGNSYGRR